MQYFISFLLALAAVPACAVPQFSKGSPKGAKGGAKAQPRQANGCSPLELVIGTCFLDLSIVSWLDCPDINLNRQREQRPKDQATASLALPS